MGLPVNIGGWGLGRRLLGVPGLGAGLAATVVYWILALVACPPGGVVLFSIAVPVGAGRWAD
jgi:hypothetical protein